MRWLRSHMRLGSWAALFALAIQLALSFGHVHLGRGDPRSWGPLVLRWAAEPAPALPDAPAVPASHKPAGLAGDLCIICSAMQLAYTVAALPSLPLPAAVSQILLDSSGDFAIAACPLPGACPPLRLPCTWRFPAFPNARKMRSHRSGDGCKDHADPVQVS